jgi:hypothetical protein
MSRKLRSLLIACISKLVGTTASYIQLGDDALIRWWNSIVVAPVDKTKGSDVPLLACISQELDWWRNPEKEKMRWVGCCKDCCVASNSRTGVRGKRKTVSMAMRVGADAGVLRLARRCRRRGWAPTCTLVRARQQAPASPSRITRRSALSLRADLGRPRRASRPAAGPALITLHGCEEEGYEWMGGRRWWWQMGATCYWERSANAMRCTSSYTLQLGPSRLHMYFVA